MSSITAVPLQPVKRSVLVYLWAGIAIAVLGAFALAWMAPLDPVSSFLATNRKAPGVIQTASGLQYEILSPGKGGATPTDTDTTLVNYEGKLLDGTSFDKSERPTPLPVKNVVPGFAEALKLMPKESKYRFWVMPSLGYGEKARGPIPAHSVLVFEVEMVDFKSEAEIRQLQMQQQLMQQQRGAGAGGLPPGQ